MKTENQESAQISVLPKYPTAGAGAVADTVAGAAGAGAGAGTGTGTGVVVVAGRCFCYFSHRLLLSLRSCKQEASTTRARFAGSLLTTG